MFESIAIRNQNHGPAAEPLDLGFLAEAMIFYGTVTVIADSSILRQLILSLGPEVLLELLEERFMQLTFLQNGMGVQTIGAGTANEHHDVCLFSSPTMELQNRAPTFMEEATGKRERGRRLGKRLIDLASTDTYDTTVTEQSREDLADATYVEEGARQILAAYAPEYQLPEPFEFRVTRESGRLRVITTVDFVAANAIYHTRIPASHSTLTPAYILSFLSSTRAHLQFASRHASELALEEVNASLVRLRVNRALEQRSQSQRDIQAFQDFVFDNGYCIREAINSKRRTFPELIEVLKNARKFKSWLTDQGPDQDLLKSYFRESTKDTWIEKLPRKGFALDNLFRTRFSHRCRRGRWTGYCRWTGPECGRRVSAREDDRRLETL